MTNLTPAAQAVASAYDDTPEKDTGNHRYLWLAAALRAAVDQVVPKTRAIDSDLDYEAWEQQQRTRVEILAIVDELENHG
jgi:hypothetical protein